MKCTLLAFIYYIYTQYKQSAWLISEAVNTLRSGSHAGNCSLQSKLKIPSVKIMYFEESEYGFPVRYNSFWWWFGGLVHA